MEADELRTKADQIREADPAGAAGLYEKAAALGDAASCSSLGYMLMVGEGVPADREKAVEWLSEASDLGDVKAMCNLGSLVLEDDPVRALGLFEKAGKMGSITGRGTPP